MILSQIVWHFCLVVNKQHLLCAKYQLEVVAIYILAVVYDIFSIKTKFHKAHHTTSKFSNHYMKIKILKNVLIVSTNQNVLNRGAVEEKCHASKTNFKKPDIFLEVLRVFLFLFIPLFQSAFRHIRRYAHVSLRSHRCILQSLSLSFRPKLFRSL